MLRTQASIIRSFQTTTYLGLRDRAFEIEGTPKDADGARNLAERDKYQFQWWACSLVNAAPYQGKKKGADSGIDGLIFFHDTVDSPSYAAKRNRRGLGGGQAEADDALVLSGESADDTNTTPNPSSFRGGARLGEAKKIVVSVKGGENVNVAMVRDLGHVVDREKAALGFFVTLAEPTRPMREEAVSAGFYDAPRFGSEYPKLQILTIEGLMNGAERPRFPDLTLGRSTFKRAAVEDMGAEQERIF